MLPHEEGHEYGEGTYRREWHTPVRRISWGAIIAGVVVTLAIFLTLQMLGAGIGLSAVDLTGREVTSGTSLGIGAAIWWLVTGLISLFAGGWVAARLGWLPDKLDRVLHGLTTWGAFYAVMFLLATTALGVFVGGGMALLGSTVSAAGEVAASSPEARQTGQQATQGTGLRADANEMMGNLERSAPEAKETGEQAANITGATFIGMAISMFLGALAAALGGLLAPAPRLVVAYEHEPVRTGERTYVSR